MKNDPTFDGRQLFNTTVPTSGVLAVSPGKALLMLGCLFVLCYLVGSALVFLIMKIVAGPAAAMRIGAIVQDILLFMVPAVGTALVCSRRPAELLALMRRPGAVPTLLALCVMLVSAPAQEAVIYWNYHWEWLPAGIESLARILEDNANGSIGLMLGNTSVGALILNVLIIGVAAGLCEELLFRGAFLGLLFRTRLNKHVAIWLVAIVFSALHMQLFGFVPRMLLGAFFGYLLWWSDSLWLPVIAHVLNNTVYAVSAWMQIREHGLEALEQEPSLWNVWVTLGSLAATVILIWLIRKTALND